MIGATLLDSAALQAARPTTFPSVHGLDESVRRLRALTPRRRPKSVIGAVAVGTVSVQRVVLHRSLPYVQNSFKPVFRGRFEESHGGVQLVGRFSMPWSTKLVLVAWFGLCGSLFVLDFIAFIRTGALRWQDPSAALGLTLAGLLLLGLGKWFARDDVRWLSVFVEGALRRR